MHAIIGPMPVGMVATKDGLEPAAADARIVGITIDNHIPLVSLGEPYTQDEMQLVIAPSWKAEREIKRGEEADPDGDNSKVMTFIAGAVMLLAGLSLLGIVMVLYVLPFFGVSFGPEA